MKQNGTAAEGSGGYSCVGRSHALHPNIMCHHLCATDKDDKDVTRMGAHEELSSTPMPAAVDANDSNGSAA